MNRLSVVLLMLASSVFTYGQPTTAKADPPKTDRTLSSDKTEADDDKKSGNKVELPPEKRNPVSIPLSIDAVVIDGRPDEPVWSTAAVFKDFYQISPGNNTAPSKQTEVR